MEPEELVELSASEAIWKARPIRRCTRCGRFGDLEDGFYRSSSGRDGRMATCKECKKATSASYAARNRVRIRHQQRARRRIKLADPRARRDYYARKRASSRRYYARKRQDPRWVAERREYHRKHRAARMANRSIRASVNESRRLLYNLKRDDAGLPRLPQRAPSGSRKPPTRPRLPGDPFRSWLARRIDETGEEASAFSTRMGLDRKTLPQFLEDESRDIEFDVVDRVLIMDGSISLDDLYPEET